MTAAETPEASADLALSDGTEPALGIRSLARRQAWGAADQIAFSFTSLALAVAVGRTASSREFGIFAFVYLGYVLALGTTEAFTAQVLLVRAPVMNDAERRKLLMGTAGTALAIGMGIAFIGLGAVLAVGGDFRSLGVPIFIAAPLLFVQNVVRYVLFAADRPRSAFLNDAAWAVCALIGFVVVDSVDDAGSAAFVWVWAIAGVCAALVGIKQSGAAPAPRDAMAWVASHGRLGARFATEYLLLFGAVQCVLVAVTLSAGLTDTAGYRGAQLVFGPLQVVLNAMRLAVTPLVVRVRRHGSSSLLRASAMVAAGATAMAVVWSVVVTRIPRDVGEAMLGEVWAMARSLMWPMAVSNIAIAIAMGALVLLRVLEATDRSLPATIKLAILTLAIGIAGAVVDGASGAAVGVAIASTIGAITFWLQSYRALTRS